MTARFQNLRNTAAEGRRVSLNQAWIIGLEPLRVERVVDLPGISTHRGLAVSGDGQIVVCPNGNANSVTLLEAATGRVIAELAVGHDALGATCTGTAH